MQPCVHRAARSGKAVSICYFIAHNLTKMQIVSAEVAQKSINKHRWQLINPAKVPILAARFVWLY